MAGTDDLAPLLTGQADGKVVMGQATIVNFNPADNTHTLDFRGSRIRDVGVLHGVSAMGYRPGQAVLLQGWIPERGTSTWWILGRALVPGQDSPDLVVRGSNIIVERDGGILVDSEDGIEVRSGGSVVVDDGGAIIVRHANGEVGAVYGDFSAIGTGGLEDGLGLLVQDENGENIFRAKEDDAGVTSVVVSASEQTIGNFQVAADSVVIAADADSPPTTAIGMTSGGIQIRSIESPNPVQIFLSTSINLDSDNQINLRSEASPPQVRMDHGTTGSAANAFLDSTTGRIQRSTSSARYKRDIRAYEPDLASYRQLRPARFFNVEQFDDEPDSQRELVGFIAEDLDDAGLSEAVIYDSQGRPDSVNTYALLAGAYELIRDQQTQLDALEQRVAKLSGASTDR